MPHQPQHLGKVAVLLGGHSAERPVSLNSGGRVLSALQSAGVNAEAFDPAERNLSELHGFDRVFVALHGGYGEDGTIQGWLELLGIPYTGSGVLASAVGMDKFRTKLLWQAAGLSVPAYRMLSPKDLSEAGNALGYPLFVKPAREGSSIGVHRVESPSELLPAFEEAHQHDDLVMAEQAVTGGEYTVGIVGGQALPIIRIEPATLFYDYEAKYLRDDTRYHCPCGLSAAQEASIQAEALKAFEVLGGRGWGRVDFLMDHAGQHYFLEANTAPGMTDHSLVPMAAKAAGMDYTALVLTVLSLARTDKKQGT